MIVCPLHWYYSAAHLVEVQEEMRRRGPPSLRGFLDEEAGAFYLREGTHRIRAALALGLSPTLIRVPWWRSRGSLVSARFAAQRRGLLFEAVDLR